MTQSLRATCVFYVLTGDAALIPQLEQSVKSLRRWGRYRGKIRVITDLPLEKFAKRHRMEVVRVASPIGALGSRHWKTQVGSLSTHDLNLFLDVDTLVLNPVSLLFDQLGSGADDVLLGLDRLTAAEALRQSDLFQHAELARSSGLGIAEHPYFNSGVIAWRGTAAARALFRKWHEEWATYRGRDQLALARALTLVPCRAGALPRRMHYLDDPISAREPAMIYHYCRLKAHARGPQVKSIVRNWRLVRWLGQTHAQAYLSWRRRLRETIGMSRSTTRPANLRESLVSMALGRQVGRSTASRCLSEPGRILVYRREGDIHCFLRRDHRAIFPASWGRLKNLSRMLWSVCEVVRLMRLWKKYRFTILDWGNDGFYHVPILLAYLLPLKTRVFLQGSDALRSFRSRRSEFVFKRMLRRADSVVCGSTYLQECLEDNLPFPMPCSVIYPRPRVEQLGGPFTASEIAEMRASFRNARQIPETAIVLLSVGPLEPYKGHLKVLEAIAALGDRGAEVFYFICGEGPHSARLRARAKELGIAESVAGPRRIQFMEKIKPRDLARFYAAADLFAMPSTYDAATSDMDGYVGECVDAAYLGTPALGSHVGGMRDVVQDGRTGLLVDPESPSSILAALERLCFDRAFRAWLASNARRWAEQLAELRAPGSPDPDRGP